MSNGVFQLNKNPLIGSVQNTDPSNRINAIYEGVADLPAGSFVKLTSNESGTQRKCNVATDTDTQVYLVEGTSRYSVYKTNQQVSLVKAFHTGFNTVLLPSEVVTSNEYLMIDNANLGKVKKWVSGKVKIGYPLHTTVVNTACSAQIIDTHQ
jgi:hypothetical protein